MPRSFLLWFALFGCLAGTALMHAQTPAVPQPQYPLADKLADKIIAKYQTSSCAQLIAQKQAPPNAQHEEMETKVIELLKQNPPMRQHFLNRIAGPIVNKMFECGMIP
jgi:hypothetical protein